MNLRFGPRSGLSLLEMLVSLALLALIAAGLAGAFGLGNQLWGRTQLLGNNIQEISLRQQSRHLIRQALPPTRLTPFNAGLKGTANSISFVTLAESPHTPDAAIMRVSITGQEQRLVLFVEELDDDANVIRSSTELLAKGANNIRFDYFGVNSESLNEGWQSSWDDTATLPRLMRIQIDEGSVPPWPMFTVKLRLQ